jgi:hypothetical protein
MLAHLERAFSIDVRRRLGVRRTAQRNTHGRSEFRARRSNAARMRGSRWEVTKDGELV